jgi:NitT/TauT family transport system substrate-binding protein
MSWSRPVRTVAIAVGLALSLGAAGCSSDSSDSGSSGTKVRIGITAATSPFELPAIAEDLKLYPADVDVSYTVMDSATITSAIATGKIDLALQAPPKIDISVESSNADLKWIAQWADPADFQMVVGPGIESFDDLKGESIAVTTPGSATDLLSRVAMSDAGIDSDDYKVLPVGNVGAMVSAFASGSVSAFILPSPAVSQVLDQVSGSKVLYDFFEEQVPWIGSGVVAYMPWASSHRAAVESVLTGLNAAVERIHSGEDESEVKASLAEFENLKPESVDTVYKALQERTTPTIEPVNVDTLKSIYASVREADDSDVPADGLADEIVDPSFVQAVVKQK